MLFAKLPALAVTPRSASENIGFVDAAAVVKLTVNPSAFIDTHEASLATVKPLPMARMHESVCCPRCVPLGSAPSLANTVLAHWFPLPSMTPKPRAALDVETGTVPTMAPALAWMTTSG